MSTKIIIFDYKRSNTQDDKALGNNAGFSRACLSYVHKPYNFKSQKLHKILEKPIYWWLGYLFVQNPLRTTALLVFLPQRTTVRTEG